MCTHWFEDFFKSRNSFYIKIEWYCKLIHAILKFLCTFYLRVKESYMSPTIAWYVDD